MCRKLIVSFFRVTKKQHTSAAYSQNAHQVMSGESVTDIVKLISQPGLLALTTASQRFSLIKKHPGVCKRVVGASAHPGSLTYWLFKPLRLSHGARMMNVNSPLSRTQSRFLPLFLLHLKEWKASDSLQTCCLGSRGDQRHSDSYTALFRHNPAGIGSSLATFITEQASSSQGVVLHCGSRQKSLQPGLMLQWLHLHPPWEVKSEQIRTNTVNYTTWTDSILYEIWCQSGTSGSSRHVNKMLKANWCSFISRERILIPRAAACGVGVTLLSSKPREEEGTEEHDKLRSLTAAVELEYLALKLLFGVKLL